jgi:hypothetical protein
MSVDSHVLLNVVARKTKMRVKAVDFWVGPFFGPLSNERANRSKPPQIVRDKGGGSRGEEHSQNEANRCGGSLLGWRVGVAGRRVGVEFHGVSQSSIGRQECLPH